MTENNICRVCLSTTEIINIFSNTDTGIISDKIMSVTKIQISPKDGLPTSICITCVTKLDECIDFVRLCEKTDRDLRKALIKAENHTKTETNFEYDTLNTESSNKMVLNNENHMKGKSVVNENKSTVNDHNKSDICNKITHKWQCFTCGKVMSSSFRLKTHLATHTDEKPYSCSYCNKKFSLSQYLNVHLRVHTGEKPFSCKICGESFAQSSGLTAHKRKHTGQMPYKCVLCPRSFRTFGHLQYHVRCHTGEKKFECDTCSRAFITRSDLKQHLLTHSGEKLHVCCICGLRSSRSSNLARHMKFSHNEEKPYECPQCPLKFIHKKALEKHKKKHDTSDLKVNYVKL